MTPYYHESPEKGPIRITDSGLFGGVFVRPESGSATHYIVLDAEKILSSYELKYDVDYKVALDIIKSELSGKVSKGSLEVVYDSVVDSSFSVFDVSTDTLDLLMEALRISDMADIGWEIQRLRGRLAFYLGYAAVDITDEYGEGTKLVVRGVLTPL